MGNFIVGLILGVLVGWIFSAPQKLKDFIDNIGRKN